MTAGLGLGLDEVMAVARDVQRAEGVRSVALAVLDAATPGPVRAHADATGAAAAARFALYETCLSAAPQLAAALLAIGPALVEWREAQRRFLDGEGGAAASDRADAVLSAAIDSIAGMVTK